MAVDQNRARAIFITAVEKHAPEAWEAFLDEECAEDPDLRKRVVALLKAHQGDDSYLDRGQVTVTAVVHGSTDEPQTQIGPYKLLQQIGEGGMGQVYMAEQLEPIKRRVALKVIKSATPTKEILARFESERQAVAMMDHQNIATVLDAGTTEDGRPYFAMELVKGLPITDYCDKNKLTPDQRLELFVQGCRAIQHAHQKGVVHRDLKPSNMLVTLYDGRPVVKVIDFGLAKALQHQTQLTHRTLFTHYGQVVGTLEYMSPEQAEMNALDVDTRTDVYSLGVILFELLTGSTPIGRDRLRSEAFDRILALIREEESPRPSMRLSDSGDAISGISEQRQTDPKRLGGMLRGDLDWIAIKALEKDRSRRYDGPAALADDVERFLSGDTVAARPPTTSYRLKKAFRKHKAGILTGVALLLLLIAGLIGTGAMWLRASDEASAARTAETQAADAAERATAEAERATRQLRIATAVRLATQSQLVRAENPATSALLALEAVNHTRREDGTVVPTARETLASTQSVLGGIPFAVGAVAAVTSADNRWLIAGGPDRHVQIWDLSVEAPLSESKELLAVKQTPLAISCDRRWVLTEDDTTAQLWDTQMQRPTGQPLASIYQPGLNSDYGLYRPPCLFSPDGRWLVIAGPTQVGVWDLTSSDPRFSAIVLMKHQERLTHMAISPDSRWIALGNRTGVVRVWDLTADDVSSSMRTLTGHEDVVSRLAFSPDSGRLVSSSFDSTARLWELNAADPSASPLVFQGHQGRVFKVAIHENWLATAGVIGLVRLYDLSAEDPTSSVRILAGHSGIIWGIAFSSNERWLVTSAADKTARVWDLHAADPASMPRELLGHSSHLYELTISPDSRHLITFTHDEARLWPLDEGDALSREHVVRAHQDAIYGMMLSPDGEWLVTGSADRTARAWRLTADGRPSSYTVLSGHDGAIQRPKISGNSRWVVTAGEDETARVWDLHASDPASAVRILRGHQGDIRGVAINSDGRRVVTGSYDKTARIWNLDDPDTIPTSVALPHGDLVFSVTITPDGRMAATACFDDTARVFYLTEDGQVASSRVFSDHKLRVGAVAISPDRRWLATGSGDTLARLWDLTAPETEVRPIVLAGHDGHVRPILFTSDGRWLITGGSGGQVRLWDITAQDPSSSYRILTRRAGNVRSLSISHDGRWLVFGGSLYAGVLDMRPDDSEPPVFLRGHAWEVQDAFMTPNNRWVITGSWDGTVRLWNTNLESLMAEVRKRAGRELTADERVEYMVPEAAGGFE